MLIAWSDHAGLPKFGFAPIPLINAIALLWCFRLPYFWEFQGFLLVLSGFGAFFSLNIKYQYVCFMQLLT